MKRGLLSGLIAWVSGLASILFVSFIRFETPGLPDIIGFGGILFGGAIILVALYLVSIRLLRRWKFPISLFVLIPWILAIIVNLPVYILLWRAKAGYLSGEAFLFTLGLFVIGFAFGAVYLWHGPFQTRRKWKWIHILTIFALNPLAVVFDYQFFYQDESRGSVRSINNMEDRRSAHTATVLRDGRILIVGGILSAEGVEINNASAEIFDPNTETFSRTGIMKYQRAGHTATLLPDGNVLITGGFDSNGFLSSAEIYVTALGNFIPVEAKMLEPRAAHTATVLQSGKVLLAGGVNGTAASNQSAEIYDPENQTFTKTGLLNTARTGHTSTLLQDGNVLVAGGSSMWRSGVLSSCELYDPGEGRFFLIDSLNIPRNKHLAILMHDGRVMIIGGSSTASTIGGRYNSVEVYDPKQKKFDWLPSALLKPRFKITNAGDVMEDGSFIVAGDGKYIEVFDPAQNNFFTALGSLRKAWMYQTVTSYAPGRILITGGYDAHMKTTHGAWIYERRNRRAPISLSGKQGPAIRQLSSTH